MRWLSDSTLAHLQQVVNLPDLGDTRYELVEEIGQGGMGIVYLARDRLLDRPVALKVLSDPISDPQSTARLTAEAHILAQLEHPGMVPVHDSGVLPDGRSFYVMKYVRGQRLDAYASQPATLGERLRIFEKICEAVGFAHAQGVIHRDLKPQNIMLGGFGEVLVMDWGVAKRPGQADSMARPALEKTPAVAFEGRGYPTVPGTILGTPGYMAPEQLRGETDRIDQRTDIYALGAILRFLLTGKLPEPASSTVKNEKPNLPMPGLTGHLSGPLEAICRKAQAPDPGERYANVQAFSADLARFQAGQPVEAYPETVLDAVRRLARKYRTVLLLVLAYLAMRILLIFFSGR